MTEAMSLPVPLTAGSIDAYINAAHQVPMLSDQEERTLATRLREHDDLEAAQRLVLSHLRFVVRVARGYTGYGLALPDLIQEGNIGLMKAVRRFDPSVGVRLVSFAVHWVRAEIHEFILRNWRIVKVATTKAQRKLFFNLRGAKKRLAWLSHDEVSAVAEDLGVKPETVMEMESRLSSRDLAFDGPDSTDDEDQPMAPAGYLPDLRSEPLARLEKLDTAEHDRTRLYAALEGLDERSRAILDARWLSEKKQTLHELGNRFGVSAERIRQLEKKAMNRLQGELAA